MIVELKSFFCWCHFPNIIKWGDFRMSEADIENKQEANKNNLKTIRDHPITLTMLGILIPAVATLIWTLSSMNTSLEHLTTDMAAQEQRIESFESRVQEQISQIAADLSDKIDPLKGDISSLKESIAMLNVEVFNYRPTATFANAITMTYDGIDAPSTSTPVQLTPMSYVVYSTNSPGREYTVEQVAQQPLLLPYTENEKEVFFYGQLDGTGNWDGHCIVNIYKDDQLQLITDAEYDSGNLLSCKQVFPDTVTNGQDVWVISNRKMHDGFNSGETWRYLRTGSYTKSFHIGDVEVSDILSADDFYAEIDHTLEGYYSGRTAGGLYNDDTGNAYFVKFFEDGTVRTLYVGGFENGQFDDQSENAWMIGKLRIGAEYSYYQGPFKNGVSSQESRYWEEPITVERIEEILQEKNFSCNCDLKWVNHPI